VKENHQLILQILRWGEHWKDCDIVVLAMKMLCFKKQKTNKTLRAIAPDSEHI
jgi:hypothetical protein